MNYTDYLIEEKLPLFWCAGCGDGIVLQAILRALAALELPPEEVVVVTGIGCWGKADDYIRTNTFHGTHGRALAFATGIKLANPALTVLVLMGDGDGVTIGGNHFIHAARRNVDLTAVLINNFNYGMTGGQYSGTTPEGAVTTTSRLGHIEPPMDICRLAEAAGAPFVARGSVSQPVQLEKLVRAGIEHRGFAAVEAMAPCPTHFGRLNGMRAAPDLMRWIEERTLPAAKARGMDAEALRGKWVTGLLHEDKEAQDYGARYAAMSSAGKGGAGR